MINSRAFSITFHDYIILLSDTKMKSPVGGHSLAIHCVTKIKDVKRREMASNVLPAAVFNAVADDVFSQGCRRYYIVELLYLRFHDLLPSIGDRK
jgi:hypothetical protein